MIRDDLADTAGNPDLVNLEGLNQLEWVGSFHFSMNGLQDLSAMSNLAAVDDLFQFFGLRKLANCHGLEALRTVGGKTRFLLNEELTSLDGLSGLEWIGSDLEITNNPKLQSLSGLSSLRQVDGNVIIQFNDTLPAGEVDALLARIVVGGGVRLDP